MRFRFLTLALLMISGQLVATPENKRLEVAIKLSTKGNNIAFDVQAIQVPFGRDISIMFENKADKNSEILHNIAILAPGSEKRVLAYFEETDYDPEKIKKHKDVLAITPTLEPGQKSTLNLSTKTLNKPGYYPYLCLIPGHASMLGMKGLMKVNKK